MSGQGWLQLGELVLAFSLSALVGIERELRGKSAGLRTHCLVGVSSALFMLISKYGFNDVLAPARVILDPSRVAAQIVSGIGFIGGGVIFMRRDVVRGLTTAASVWLTAALGMACGAGLIVLALATAVGHFAIMLGLPLLVRRLPRSRRSASELRVVYADGRGLLRRILLACSESRFAVHGVRIGGDDDLVSAAASETRDPAESATRSLARVTGDADPNEASARTSGTSFVTLVLQLRGKRPVTVLVERLASLDGVSEVSLADADREGE